MTVREPWFSFQRRPTLFIQIGSWFALDTRLAYVRLGRTRRWVKRWMKEPSR